MLVPKLRFKREDGTEYPDWEETYLNDVCDIIGGGTPSTQNTDYWNGDIQWFTPAEIGKTKYVSKSVRTISQAGFEKSSARILPVGTILLTSRATLGEMAIATIECTTNQGFQSLIPQRINGEYLYYLQPAIKSYCYKKACGSTFSEISKGELGKCKIPIPCLEEQQKIADFLSTVDEVIAQSEAEVANLQQQKKAAMQKIFSQEVRFKREDGTSYPEWENVKFGSLIKEYRDRTSIENEDVLLSSAISGMFLNTELFGHQRGKSNIGYLKINYGTLILSAQNLHLGNANVNLRFEHGIISPAYKTYHITNCNLYFMAQWIKREKTNQFFYNATTVGASQCRRNVDWNALYKQSILIPHLEEQQKIADFLATYDEAISCAKQELDKWKELKKGLLQQMFA